MRRKGFEPLFGGENRHVGGSQGRKSDDERHRLRRGRWIFWKKISVTKSLSILSSIPIIQLVTASPIWTQFYSQNN